MVRRHQSAGPLPGTPTTAGSGTAALLALQRAAGNAAVLRAMEQERHTRGPGCGHHEERQDTVQRSAVHEVLRGAGSPLDGSLRQEADDRDHLEHEEHAGPRYRQMRPSKEDTRSANLRMQDRLAREAHAPNARRTPHVAVTHVPDEALRYSSNSGQKKLSEAKQNDGLASVDAALDPAAPLPDAPRRRKDEIKLRAGRSGDYEAAHRDDTDLGVTTKALRSSRGT